MNQKRFSWLPGFLLHSLPPQFQRPPRLCVSSVPSEARSAMWIKMGASRVGWICAWKSHLQRDGVCLWSSDSGLTHDRG